MRLERALDDVRVTKRRQGPRAAGLLRTDHERLHPRKGAHAGEAELQLESGLSVRDAVRDRRIEMPPQQEELVAARHIPRGDPAEPVRIRCGTLEGDELVALRSGRERKQSSRPGARILPD